MQRGTRALGLAIALLLLSAPAFAEEVVIFKSGAAMPIVSHKVDGDMIHVDLGDNAFMAFPMAVVDRVEKAGKNVMIQASTTGGTNVMRARPDPTGSFPVHGQAPSNSRSGNREDEPVVDPALDVVNGVAVYRPVAGSGNPSKADTAVTGNRRVLQGTGPGSLRGARQEGIHQVIGPIGPRSRNSTSPKPVITGISPRAHVGGAPIPPSGSSGSEAGGSSPD